MSSAEAMSLVREDMIFSFLRWLLAVALCWKQPRQPEARARRALSDEPRRMAMRHGGARSGSNVARGGAFARLRRPKAQACRPWIHAAPAGGGNTGCLCGNACCRPAAGTEPQIPRDAATLGPANGKCSVIMDTAYEGNAMQQLCREPGYLPVVPPIPVA